MTKKKVGRYVDSPSKYLARLMQSACSSYDLETAKVSGVLKMPSLQAQSECDSFFQHEDSARILDFKKKEPHKFFGKINQTCDKYGVLLLAQENHFFGNTDASEKINLCPRPIRSLKGVEEVETCYKLHNDWRKNGSGKMLPYQKQIFMEKTEFGAPPKELYLTTKELVSDGYLIDGLQLHFGGSEINLDRSTLGRPYLICEYPDDLPIAVYGRVEEFNRRY